MKKLLVLVACCSVVVLHAQITLTPASNFTAGTTHITGNRNSNLAPNVVQGNAGPSQSWNFVTTTWDYYDTTNFISVSSVPASYSAPYPQSNFAHYKDSDTTRYTFWHTDANGLHGDGSANTDPNFGIQYQHYQDPLTYMGWPMTYGTTLYDTAYTDYTSPIAMGSIDSTRQVMEVYYTIEADAWGTITTSYGSYNVLRVKREGHYTIQYYTHDTVSGWSFPITSFLDERLYEFWTDAAIGWPIARLAVNWFSDTVTGYWIMTNLITDVNALVKKEDALEIYPNPASEEITIATEVGAQWEIADVMGRVVITGVARSEWERIDVAALAEGIYVISSIDNVGTRTSRRLVVE
jgi:hypothetical protein